MTDGPTPSEPGIGSWLGRTADQLARAVVSAVDPLAQGVTAHAARVELEGLTVAGLALRRLVVDATDLGFSGPPPGAARFGQLTVTIELRERDVNRWAELGLLPMRLSFEPDRIRARTGVAGVRVSSVDVRLEMSRRWLRLRATGADVLGATIPVLLQPGFPLPLPPLPYNVRLAAVEPLDGLLRITFEGTDVRLPI